MRRLLLFAAALLFSVPAFSQSVSFSPIRVGQNPGVVVGDFNGDGREDMLEVIPTNDNTFRLRISTATGAYSPSTIYAVPGGSYASYIVGDFDRDGKLDLVLLTHNPGAIYFYRGNGNGTFQAPVRSAATFEIASGLAADANHDGKMDLVVSTFNSSDNSSNIQTYFGAGNGTFTAGPITPMPANTSVVSTGDFDGDGKGDVLTKHCTFTVSSKTCVLTVFYGDGSGGFGSPTSVTTGNAFSTVADVDGDGKSDIMASEGGSGSDDQPFLTVFYGAADRTLTLAQLRVSQCAINAPVVADFNGDHIPDIIFFQHACNPSGSSPAEVTFIPGKGNRTFGPEQTVFNSTYVQVPGSYSAVVRANNGDSKPDFFFNQFEQSGGSYGQEMYAMVNTSAGTFADCRAPNSATGFRVCSPVSGSIVSSPVRFSIGASGQVPMRKVEVWADGVKKFEQLYAFSHYAYLDTHISLNKGTHAITIISAGWDNSLQKKSYSITVQ